MSPQSRVDFNTQIVGVVGHPIKHSFSPLMHNLSFELRSLNYVYLPFDVPTQNLNDAVKGMLSLGVKGFNVTLPHKENMAHLLTDLSEEARITGSVNTVVNENGTLNGYNTDVNGIYRTLLPYKKELNGAEVSLFGAGGSARSAIYVLIRNFKVGKINLINRTLQKAERLKDYFNAKMKFDAISEYELIPPDLVGILKDSKLIINSTSLGMFPQIDDTATSIEDSFCEGQIVFDFVYNPLNTKFLEIAASKGAKILNGLNMFVEQGAKSFELWTGEKMPVKKIYKTLEYYLEKEQNQNTIE